MNIVGKYPQKFNEKLNLTLPCTDIVQSDGLIIHIQKRHPGYESYLQQLSVIIRQPDYIGKNPREPDSIELVKILDENILVAVKLDKKNASLYVASLYPIKEGTLQHRLRNGRLIPVED